MCVTELTVCGFGCLLQVQPTGLPLPERRHHAKPAVWCKSFFQRPLLQVLWWFFTSSHAVSVVSTGCFNELHTHLLPMLAFCSSDLSELFISATSSPCLPPARGFWRRRTVSPLTACKKCLQPTSLVTSCLWVTVILATELSESYTKPCFLQLTAGTEALVGLVYR